MVEQAILRRVISIALQLAANVTPISILAVRIGNVDVPWVKHLIAASLALSAVVFIAGASAVALLPSLDEASKAASIMWGSAYAAASYVCAAMYEHACAVQQLAYRECDAYPELECALFNACAKNATEASTCRAPPAELCSVDGYGALVLQSALALAFNFLAAAAAACSSPSAKAPSEQSVLPVDGDVGIKVEVDAGGKGAQEYPERSMMRDMKLLQDRVDALTMRANNVEGLLARALAMSPGLSSPPSKKENDAKTKTGKQNRSRAKRPSPKKEAFAARIAAEIGNPALASEMETFFQ